MAVETTCVACGAQFEVSPPIGRKDTCPKCLVDLRTCRQCKHYDERAPYECREHVDEQVRDKEKANYCELYQIRRGPVKSGPSKEDLRAAAEALFKKKP